MEVEEEPPPENATPGVAVYGAGLVSGLERRAVLVIVGSDTDKHSTLAVPHDDHDHPNGFSLLFLFL